MGQANVPTTLHYSLPPTRAATVLSRPPEPWQGKPGQWSLAVPVMAALLVELTGIR